MKLLISIHNEHIENIKKGHKKFEFRKVIGRQFNENEIYFYATYPTSKVVGVAKIKKVHIDKPSVIWDIAKNFSGVDKEFYYSYYHNKKLQ
ncbi:hypothetical protein [Spiroplasma tabanidicola]|uniref:ASCH domain-containing protein n=1 Tax=Spiroplasma tabanidicola TaxID=324079 RepID=A0A6I6C7S3_9MOLU|nr:hypothetical protein [Spiroplasma tabanidicola]QGS51479.1 hypothetical protein STABA_v1c01120 [Spiroplasma tabanidicola]